MNDINKCEIPYVHLQKTIELLIKWRKHIPVEHQDVTCLVPQE